MPTETIKKLGRYEVYEFWESDAVTGYSIKNIGETIIDRMQYVDFGFDTRREDMDFIFIGKFISKENPDKVLVDTTIYLIKDSVVQKQALDEKTNLIIFNKDTEKRKQTINKLEEIFI